MHTAQLEPHRLREPAARESRQRVGHRRRGRRTAFRASPPTSASIRGRRSASRSTRPPRTTARHLPDGLLRRHGRAESRDRMPSAHAGQNQPNCLTDAATGLIDCGNWAVSASWAVPDDGRVGHLLRQGHPRRYRAARATSSSSSATTTGIPTCCFRPRTRPGRPTTSTAATASMSAAPPAAPTRSATTGRFTTRGRSPGGLGLQRRVPDGPLARGQRLQRQLLRPASTPTGAARRSSSTRSFCRSATTNTGRARSAPTSKRRGRPACTSRSSAATRCSGRRAGRTASRRAERRIGRSSPTRKRTPTRRSIRRPTSGPARGATRASARRPMAAVPRTR